MAGQHDYLSVTSIHLLMLRKFKQNRNARTRYLFRIILILSAICPTKMMWMNDEQRCYCDKPLQHSVCIDIEFQKGVETEKILDFRSQSRLFFRNERTCLCSRYFLL